MANSAKKIVSEQGLDLGRPEVARVDGDPDGTGTPLTADLVEPDDHLDALIAGGVARDAQAVRGQSRQVTPMGAGASDFRSRPWA